MKAKPPDTGRDRSGFFHTIRALVQRAGPTAAEAEAPPANSQLAEMAGAAISLDQTHVRDIMVPRSDVVFVYEDEEPADMLRQVVESGFTRLPIADNSEQKILGILHAKDLLKARHNGSGEAQALRDLVRPVLSVPESMRASALLEQLRRQHAHMAAVVDEYGGIAGIVTLEDVIEEIVGEIEDEHAKTSPTPSIETTEHGWITPGNLPIADFNSFFKTHLPESGDADTLSGAIVMQLGRVPRAAEKIELEDYTLSVDAVSKGRIQRLSIQHGGGSEQVSAEKSA